MTTLIVPRGSGPFTHSAFDLLLKDNKEYTLKDLPEAELEEPLTSNPSLVAMLPWFSADDGQPFLRLLTQSWRFGCRRFILIAPETNGVRPWHCLPPLQASAFDRLVQIPEWNAFDSLFDAIAATAQQQANHTMNRIQRTVEANFLYRKYIGPFSHGRQNDLANHFLGPARLLLMDNKWSTLEAKSRTASLTAWKIIWNTFETEVLNQTCFGHGELDKELKAASEPITRWLRDGDLVSSFRQIETIMAILTECRLQAGQATKPSRNTHTQGELSPVVQPIESGTSSFRVLIVDDHAAAWRPVFELLSKMLDNVSFVFSEDGKTIRTETGAVASPRLEPIQYPFYDLVILDIFIGDKDGRDILRREIREDLGSLPVLLWTTSHDNEVTSKASQANGILLKKSVSWDTLESTIRIWLPHGRNRRDSSLPSPFFDHVISDTKHRALVKQANEWCLKQLDSFHALDGSYFRYFTDHGGRHIVKLFGLLEKAMYPFLDNADPEVLPSEQSARKFELLALYLVVVCHELGMFPMKSGKTVEDFSALGDDYLDDVRTLHAPRGMALLHHEVSDAPNSHCYWSDSDGRELSKAMAEVRHPGDPNITLRDFVAILVGYHARCMKSLKDTSFLTWFDGDDAQQDRDPSIRDRFSGLRSSAVSLGKSDLIFREAIADLRRIFDNDIIRNRIRRQCAVFRFVDAIDIARSRNPALFLIHSRNRRAIQNREYLKREVCDEVSIEDGMVRAKFCASQPDDNWVKLIFDAREYFLDPKEFLRFQEVEFARLSCTLDNPWKIEFTNDMHTNMALLGSSARLLQQPIDAWLIATWKVIMGGSANPGFLAHLRSLGVLHEDERSLRIGINGPRIVASITALSVAGEVLDEYEAIIDAELTGQLKLDVFDWDPGREWNSGETPRKLTILRDGLAQYPSAMNG